MPRRRVVLACLLICLAMAAKVSATILHPGKWTQLAQVYPLTATAVNMMLLPGSNPADPVRSQVLYWADDHSAPIIGEPDGNHGGRFDWLPGSDAWINAGNFPDTSPTGTFVPDILAATGFNIFCSGLGHLPSGEGFVVGGTTEAENGETRAATYNPVTKQWTVLAGRMQTGRWYPSATTLPDGRMLITSGSRYRNIWTFGGDASDIQLYRLPVSHTEPGWLPAVVPEFDSYVPLNSPERVGPLARHGHTATFSLGSRQAIFGGQMANGQPTNELWLLARDENQGTPDYKYLWHRRTPLTGASAPSARAFHCAVSRDDNELVIFGGLSGSNQPLGDVWSVSPINNSRNVTWEPRAPTSTSDPFPARFGHTAFWHKDPANNTANDCAYVFGGSGSFAGLPTDNSVYQMKLVGTDSVEWKQCTLESGSALPPSPRMYMATGHFRGKRTASGPEVDGMFLYGGSTSSGSATNDLYVLWITGPTTVSWQVVPQSGDVPPALVNAGGAATENSGEFWLSGGKVGATAKSETYSFDARLQYDASGANTLSATWVRRADAPHAVWGHTFVPLGVEEFTRIPEICDPSAQDSANQFTPLTTAALAQDWYPHMFVLPGTTNGASRVFFAGPVSRDVRSLSVIDSSGTWSSPITEDPVGLRGGSSVMYRPGKIMKCGSRDTDGIGQAKGLTRIVDATAGSPYWAPSGDMISRVNHNLVIMPDGKVIVVGGTGYITNGDNGSPRTCPEIWDPNVNLGAGVWGKWEGAGYLDSSSVWRGYHSSALLLPDGRILCAGGNATTSLAGPHHNDQLKMDLYSPPYLFTAAGAPAQRPVITSLPRRAAYGEIVAAAISDSMIVSRVTLVRPGAVTHGFDENQRFIELAFHCDSRPPTGQSIYHVSLPSDSTVAPPGEYMLFMLNEAGTPSVARWIRLNNINGQSGAPSAITNLGKFCSDGQSMDLFWTPPVAVEGAAIATPVAAYELRYSTTGSLTNANFSSGTLVSPVTTPGDPMGAYTDRLNGFPTTLGLTYRFRMRSKNYSSGNGVWSALSNQLVFTAHDEDCGGAGGGGGGYYDGGFTANRTGRTVALRRPGGGSADTSFVENTLLPVIRLGSVATDRVRLPNGPKWEGATGRVRLSRAGNLGTNFEGVQLVAVDHATEDEVFIRGGEFVAGTVEPVVSVHHADGRDLTADLASGEGFEGRDGDTLYVDVQHHEPGTLVLSSSKSQLVKFPDVTGIRIATETSNGWVDIGHHNPRKRASDEAFAAPALDRVRLIFMGEHKLEGVARLVPGGGVRVQRVAPTSVTHSQWGDVTSMVAEGEGLPLQGGESAYAEFPYSEAPVDTVRDWYLEVTGSHFQGGGAAIAARMSGAGEVTPTRFALAPGSPNPFHGSTRLAFELPVRAKVRLEVFDVTGRRVATPVDASYAAGRHSVEWAGVGADGRPVAAGVFLCRMTAGEFRAERRLVLVK